MDLIVVLLVCVLIGFLTYLLTTHVPMPAGFARAIQIAVLVILILWLVSQFVRVPNVLPVR